jgi:2-dehydro-3-deoxyphosphogluconate aldolase/(4S)-4-hydroxy-2-oxoglutarate aldolase
MFQKYDVLKLFPSNSIEIINYLKTINGPFPKIKFIPTGGVNIKNYKKILSLPNVIGVAGSFLFPLNSKNLIDFVKLNRILKNI